MHVRWLIRSSNIQERLSEIEVGDQRLVDAPRFCHTWPPHQQRGVQAFFIHPAFIKPPVLTEPKTLVGTVNHNRVLSQSRLVKVLEHPANVLIHSFYAAQVVLDIALIVPAGALFAGQLGVLDSLVAWSEISIKGFELLGGKLAGVAEHQATGTNVVGDPHFMVGGSRAATRIIIEQRWRFGNFNVVKFPQVPQCRFPSAVRCLVLAHQEERLLVIPPVKPLECLVRDDVGSVTGMLDVLAIGDQHWIVILALALEHLEMIEARGS